jgi:hypothetical protein
MEATFYLDALRKIVYHVILVYVSLAFVDGKQFQGLVEPTSCSPAA